MKILFFLLIILIKAIYEIPLKIAFLDEKRSKLLLNMKFLQNNF
jgi:hypothetical protein